MNIDEIKGKYNLTFKYFDIYSNEYSQCFKMELDNNIKNICCHSIDTGPIKNPNVSIEF